MASAGQSPLERLRSRFDAPVAPRQPGDHHAPHGSRGMRNLLSTAAMVLMTAVFPPAASGSDDAASGQKAAAPQATRETAILAGGCFWGMEEILRRIPGVRRDRGRLHRREQLHRRSTTMSTTEPRVTPKPCASCSIRRSSASPTCSRSGSSRCTTRPRSTARATTSARSTARRSSSRRTDQRSVAEEVKARVDRSGKWKRPIVTEIVDRGSVHAGRGVPPGLSPEASRTGTPATSCASSTARG